MKKIYAFFMVFAITLTTKAQLVFNENFSGFTPGPLGTQGGWVQNGTGFDVQVANTAPLIFSGYTSGSEYITVTDEDGIDPHKAFSTAIPTNSNRFIFMSFVVSVSSAPEAPNNNQFSIALRNTANIDVAPRFYIAEDAGPATTIEFGIAVGDENPTYTNLNLAYNTTYLIVIRYDVVAGNNNDNAYMWINPGLSAEPNTGAANASVVSSNGEVPYGSVLNSLIIAQTSTVSPVAAFDAFRVAHGATSFEAWTNLNPPGAPLPVLITSFNAAKDGLNIKLVWNTAEESGITSYVVEKSTDGRTFEAIGTVAAARQKTYSFTDAQSGSEYSYYRLKIMEADGSNKLSYIVSLKSKLSLSILLSPNPVTNKLMIQHPKASVNGHIQIMNAHGQLIKDIKLPASAVISNVDMSGLARGMYHVIFRNGPDMFTKTVLKQ